METASFMRINGTFLGLGIALTITGLVRIIKALLTGGFKNQKELLWNIMSIAVGVIFAILFVLDLSSN